MKLILWSGAAVVALWIAKPTAALAGGTITGTVTIAGSEAGTTQPDDVVVSVEGLHYPATDGKAPASETLSLDQKDLRFVPHVLPVPAGVPITFHNHDSVLHNVHSASVNNPPFNFAIMKNRTRSVTFEKPEVVHVRCDVHSEMSAFIVVEDNPFYARPDKDGRFTIMGVPAGTYTIRAWHEKAGTAEQRVTVAEGATATATFSVGK